MSRDEAEYFIAWFKDMAPRGGVTHHDRVRLNEAIRVLNWTETPMGKLDIAIEALIRIMRAEPVDTYSLSDAMACAGGALRQMNVSIGTFSPRPTLQPPNQSTEPRSPPSAPPSDPTLGLGN